MPDNQDEYTPRNTWAYIEQGTCIVCMKPRDLYANSWVPNLVACGYCIVSKMSIMVDNIAGAMDGLENGEIRYWESRWEYRNMYDNRTAITIATEMREGLCAVCYHPILPDDRGYYASAIGYDANMAQVDVHASCTNTCDPCGRNYARWNGDSRLTTITMERYFGIDRCPSCVDELLEEYGGSNEFKYCGSCESMETRSAFRDFQGTGYCEDCYHDYVHNCDECDTDYWHEDSHDCDDISNLVHDYSYRPRPHFFGEGKYYFGFELEVESNNNSRKQGANYVIDNLGSHAYLKRDASLDEGFEIVTHPHTLDEYQKNFNWDCMSGLRRLGYRSWDTRTCGLHVHVSRTAFGEINKQADLLKAQAHELRFIKLIYDNQRQIERLAGRSSSYARFNDKGNLANRVKYGQQDDRYEAVNSQNSETLEVRVFKGSLKPARVLSAIELVHASVEYTRDLKVNGSNRALKWINFVRFVADNENTYPNLVSSIQSTFDTDRDPTDVNN